MNNETNEKILLKAIELREKKRKPEEILEMFPESEKEIREIFELIQMLENEKHKLDPSECFFKETLEKANFSGGVTKSEDDRFLKKRENGRSSLINNLMQNFMGLKRKIAFSVIAVAVISGFIFYYFNSKDNHYADEKNAQSQPPIQVEDQVKKIAEQENSSVEKASLPEATGDADGTVDAIIASITAEQAILEEEFNDAESITEDDEEINNFFQTYDENSI